MREWDSHHLSNSLAIESLNHTKYRLLRLKGTWGNQVHIRDSDLRPLMDAEGKRETIHTSCSSWLPLEESPNVVELCSYAFQSVSLAVTEHRVCT